jgi:hypothetical protein
MTDEKPPAIGSLFGALFGESSAKEHTAAYLASLKEYYEQAEAEQPLRALKNLNPPEHPLPEGVTAEETIRLYGRAYGVTWHSAREIN